MPYLNLPACKLFYTIDDHTGAWTKPETALFVHGFIVILPIDGYRAAGSDPDMTARMMLDFIARRKD
jgi:hypothetical protein